MGGYEGGVVVVVVVGGMRRWGVSRERRSYKGLMHYLEHTPSIAFRHLPTQEEGGKPGLGVCISS